MKGMRSVLVQFRCNERLYEMLNEMCEASHCTRPEFIRALISAKYHKMFPPYLNKGKTKRAIVEKVEGAAEEVMSNEQLCEKAGGKVQRVDGVEMCVFQLTTSMQRRVPLNKPDLFEK